MTDDFVAKVFELANSPPDDRQDSKDAKRLRLAVDVQQTTKGVVDYYCKRDGTIGIDALVPASVAPKMLAAIFVGDVVTEFTRLGISFPHGNALVESHSLRFHVRQAVEGGMVAIDAQVSVPAAAMLLIQAHATGVPTYQHD